MNASFISKGHNTNLSDWFSPHFFVIVTEDAREPKIRDLGELIGMGQEDVPRGQVHVDYALPLQIIHAVCYLQHRVSLNDKTVLLANR